MQLQFFLLQGGELFPVSLLPFFPVEKPLEAQGSFRDAIRQGQQTLMRLVRGERMLKASADRARRSGGQFVPQAFDIASRHELGLLQQ